MALVWETDQHTSFTLYDIDREFQNSNDAYHRWQARQKRRRSPWACLAVRHQDDALAKVLRLGRQVQKLMDAGKESFGTPFEKGDSTCHSILSAQLLRLQYEIRQPLYERALSPTLTSIPYDDIIMTAKSIQRTCLAALRDQFARFDTRNVIPLLPPPRFKVEYCPFADELRKDLKKSRASNLRTQRAQPSDRYDDRELCPRCNACISVTAHSGLPDYRCILFTSHVARAPAATAAKATFACNSCYKTFADSYAFLEHVFQRQIGSERSCMKRTSSMLSATSSSTLHDDYLESDPSVVEQCLRNCLIRELTRVRTQKRLRAQEMAGGVRSGVVVREKQSSPSMKDSVIQERELDAVVGD